LHSHKEFAQAAKTLMDTEDLLKNPTVVGTSCPHPAPIGNSAFLLRGLAYFLGMPSFDIVSQVNSMEIENAVNQAKKELATRFDFKGSSAEIVLEKDEIKLSAEDQFKIRALTEIVMGKLAKRSISLKNVEKSEPDVSPLGHARQVIKIKQGLEQPVAKQITSFIRDRKFKVTTQIQGSEIRVTSKSRDELQTVIAAVRGGEFPAALQYVNFRD
jgi:cyclic-di-GMP-binding protein